jgi:hypothetical protein
MPALTVAGTGSLCNFPVRRRQTSRNVVETLQPQCAAIKNGALKLHRTAAGSSGDGFTWHDRGHDLFIGLKQLRNGSRAVLRHG